MSYFSWLDRSAYRQAGSWPRPSGIDFQELLPRVVGESVQVLVRVLMINASGWAAPAKYVHGIGQDYYAAVADAGRQLRDGVL